jgi:7-cyano-7-deazaguanine synthase
MFRTKAESIRLAGEWGGLESLAFSHTCYEGKFPPCGNCPACVLRAKGFAEAGLPDPLRQRADDEERASLGSPPKNPATPEG